MAYAADGADGADGKQDSHHLKEIAIAIAPLTFNLHAPPEFVGVPGCAKVEVNLARSLVKDA